jgi:hypothetical protein
MDVRLLEGRCRAVFRKVPAISPEDGSSVSEQGTATIVLILSIR